MAILGDTNVLGTLKLEGKNIVERGSNANGDYVRFADGTQLCWRTKTFIQTEPTNLIWGFYHTYSAVSFDWPSEFISSPVMSGISSFGSTRLILINPATSTTGGRFEGLYMSDTNPSLSGTVHVLAMGRWYA